MVIPMACLWISRNVLGLDDPLSDNVSANVIGLALANAARFVLTRQLVFGIREETPRRASAPRAETAGPALDTVTVRVHDVAHETAGTTYDGPGRDPRAAVALAGCGVTRGDDSRDLLMIIPNSPGGGYDQTGRAAVQVMEDEDITGGSFTVDNIVGAGGAGRDDRAGRQGRRRAHDDDGRARGRRLDVLLRQPVRPQRRHAASPS